MRYRPLGSSGLRVSQLFLGAMTFADGFAHGAGRAEARRIIDAYADAGGNVIDTAVNYRDGASEEILGEILAGRRDRFVVCTKYGVSRDRADPNAAGGHRKNLRLSLETSLRRLRTDHLDLYYLHLWDRLTPIEETMRALDDAVAAGTVLHIGLSDTPAWVAAQATTLAQWRGWSPVVALQARYNLLSRDNVGRRQGVTQRGRSSERVQVQLISRSAAAAVTREALRLLTVTMAMSQPSGASSLRGHDEHGTDLRADHRGQQGTWF
jgi:aryl-alcohol dehydrogenase-like predicted oxidoreductase